VIQKPEIVPTQVSLSPEQSTLVSVSSKRGANRDRVIIVG
jgi:hypothetical protein